MAIFNKQYLIESGYLTEGILKDIFSKKNKKSVDKSKLIPITKNEYDKIYNMIKKTLTKIMAIEQDSYYWDCLNYLNDFDAYLHSKDEKEDHCIYIDPDKKRRVYQYDFDNDDVEKDTELLKKVGNIIKSNIKDYCIKDNVYLIHDWDGRELIVEIEVRK